MSTLLVGAAAAEAACRDRLDLVDATFDSGPGRVQAVTELRDHYCPHCPIEAACRTAGMAEPALPWARGGAGVWGGLSANQRARALNQHRNLEEK